MKNINYLIILTCTLFVMSCDDDLLDKTQLDEISEADFLKTELDLETYANSFYQDLPGWAGVGNGYAPMPDNGTDLSIGESPLSRFTGDYAVPTTASASIWSWDEVREVNYFLDNSGEAEGDETEINHSIGEGYFFRAYYYFELLKDYGDLPIIDKYITDTDEEYLYASRDPRNEVANFIISDLDNAISLLKSFSDITAHPRVSIEAAYMLKARVALYEGTWEKYHSDTDFGVEGSIGTDFLEIAAEAAKNLIDLGTFSLNSDFESLFNQTGLSGNSEMILWRDYDYIGLTIGNDLQIAWPNRSSYTRFAVRSFLCTDGLPISLSPLYQGDTELETIETNRDPRLAATIMVPNDILSINIDNSISLFEVPIISGNNAAISAYESQKYRDVNIDASTSNFTRSTSKIIMRYAEALLIYAEAKGELGTITQNDLDISINLLRNRVGMPNLTIGGILTDPDWPEYGYTLSNVLYEIRRERSVELMNEGYRYDDLFRWRAVTSILNGNRPKGAYYEQLLQDSDPNQNVDADNYLDPYLDAIPTGYNFDETKAYLNPIPSDELILNPNLTQNPGW